MFFQVGKRICDAGSRVVELGAKGSLGFSAHRCNLDNADGRIADDGYHQNISDPLMPQRNKCSVASCPP